MNIIARVLKMLALLVASSLSAVLLAVCIALGVFLHFDAQLSVADVAELEFSEPLRIYTADKRLIQQYGKKRTPVTLQQVPEVLIDAFVAAEDDRFFDHPGVDYQGILRAAANLLTTGSKSEGGSTITMQLARNLYLSPERTYVRKIKEIILALKLESRLSKGQILVLYLNKIYLGSGAYGIGAAARLYYDKTVAEVNLAEAALLGGLPKAPTTYSPLNNPELARQRRAYVLGRMLDTGRIDQTQYEQALQKPLGLATHTADARFRAGYIAEMARQEMVRRYGDKAYAAGFNVYTTVSSERQRAAMTALRNDLLTYDARHAWRGPQVSLDDEVLTHEEQLRQALRQQPAVGGLTPAAVLEVAGDTMTLQTRRHGSVELGAADNPWLKPGEQAAAMATRGDIVYLKHVDGAADDDAAGDQWQLAQVPEVQGALVALDPGTGAIEALVGGFDARLSLFNRATDAYRQPGSSIKPFIYAAALANGFTAASLINDAPIVYGTYSGEVWRPRNYGRRIHGPTRLREGLVHSHNLMTIRLLRSIGISNGIDYLARFGLPRDRMPRNLTLALGSATFTPMQMAVGYAVMANGGYRVTPFLIDEIRVGEDRVVYKADPAIACPAGRTCAQLPMADMDMDAEEQADDADENYAPRVITAENAYIISDIMRDVINRGTGAAARGLGRSDLSGKTGTTDDTVDAWFAGFNSKLVAVSWVGFDAPFTLGVAETGAHAALPMWVDFMGRALADVPESTMPRPDDIVTVQINPRTGQRMLHDSGGIAEIFTRDSVPTEREARTYRGFDPSTSDDRLF